MNRANASTESASAGLPARAITWLKPHHGLVLLVIAHLVLTLLQSLPLPRKLTEWTGGEASNLAEGLVVASGALLTAQLALIASYISLGGGRWIVRIVRGALLLLWYELFHMAGTAWLDAGRDSQGFEYSLAISGWILVFLLAPLLLYRLIVRRRFVLPVATAAPARVQFRILDLLLITTEAAAVLAVIRGFVPHKESWREELWYGMRAYLSGFASFDFLALVILASVPAVLVAARIRSIRDAAIAILIWELLLSAGFLFYRLLLPELDPQFPLQQPLSAGGTEWLHLACHSLSTAILIWPTLVVVRWLGYDFLPFPPRGGRQSAEATSAA